MEATRRTTLYVCSVLCCLTVCAKSEVSRKFIHIPSRVHHGMEGKPLLLSVETRFPLDAAEIQGTWSLTNTSGATTVLITFTKTYFIPDMNFSSNLIFKKPNMSLLIRQLKTEYEGDYHLSVNIQFHNEKERIFKEERTIHVTVDVPVSIPHIEKSPSSAVVEDKANVTWTCSVKRGKRVVFQWFRDNIALVPTERYHFTHDNSTLFISPVRKEDKGTYHCVASNPVSKGQNSRPVELNVYYGPYNLKVKSEHGLQTGEVFTINPGELVFFECLADSNPPNSYVWISKSLNRTHIITEGPRLEVRFYRLAHAEEYLCRAFNNVTQKQDEAQFTLVVASLGTGQEKHTQGAGASVYPLVAVFVSCSLIIGCMLFFIKGTCDPRRVLVKLYSRSFSEQKRPHRSGHEDAKEDFGIYEFVSIPGKMESAQVSCKSLARLESIQDINTTIYDVIRHVPETPSHSLLK